MKSPGTRVLAVLVTVAVALPLLFVRAEKPEPVKPLAVTIVHTNDWHANHQPRVSGEGGSARQAAVVKQIKAAKKNVLLLDAGDRFTGTILHQPGGPDNVPLMNNAGFHAMTLGNHEFDDGDERLALFIKRLGFPVVSANLDVADSVDLKGLVKPFVVVDLNGEKFGVIGLTTTDAKGSNPGRGVCFDADYATCAQRAADELTRLGITRIIVLSHIGLTADRELANRLSHVDAIVGGHSHTLMSKRYQEAKAPYPVIEKDRDGRPVYIVQAGGGDGQYVGQLDLEFDADGRVTKAGGDCIHLSRFITPDVEVQERIDRLEQRVAASMKKPIVRPDGRELTAVDEFPDRDVRERETAIGNLVTDAMRKRADADLAFTGGGSIRAGIPEGVVTGVIMRNALPFDNTLWRLRLKGSVILEAIENGLSTYGMDAGNGRFLQISGMHLRFDPMRPVGKRVVSVEVREGNELRPLELNRVYTVGCDSYQVSGGDGYAMLRSKAESAVDLGFPIRDVVVAHAMIQNPLRPKLEGRISK